MSGPKPWHVRNAQLGAVYCPSGNTRYLYVIVAITSQAVRGLMLAADTSHPPSQPGKTWEQERESFEDLLRGGAVVRVA